HSVQNRTAVPDDPSWGTQRYSSGNTHTHQVFVIPNASQRQGVETFAFTGAVAGQVALYLIEIAALWPIASLEEVRFAVASGTDVTGAALTNASTVSARCAVIFRSGAGTHAEALTPSSGWTELHDESPATDGRSA